MLTFARSLVVVTSIIMVVGGIALIAAYPDELGAWIGGVILALSGVVGLLAVVLERVRYRSARAEPPFGVTRSPGGEPSDHPLGRTFQATDEVFMDPTSGRRMRVFLDPSTGERRYRPED